MKPTDETKFHRTKHTHSNEQVSACGTGESRIRSVDLISLSPGCDIKYHAGRCYHWGKRGEGHMGLSCIISYNCF